MTTTGPALDPRVRGQVRTVSIVVVVFLAAMVVNGWVIARSGSDIGVLTIAVLAVAPLGTLLALGALVIYVIEGRRIARDPALPSRQRSVAVWIPVIAAAVLAALGPSACSTGTWAGRRMLLTELQPTFEWMMAAARGGRRVPVMQHGDRVVTIAAEPGDVSRYYFEMTGMGDNGSGFVYDPTDAVLAARGWTSDRRFTAPARVRKWFGGDIVWCERVRDHYHYCGLT